ncbi:hypothetical protein POTOM_030759 [Populus tomentosa]|uniref:Major facilitator superfamily (MFS) profile domain-containing protein n=1 Tax=Populus tomentosa TaxID=118781 RepID=A0A8X7ZHB3_POPTO|nr:hypothetical protein POTOM_030759 [Populus tomentosa]
MAEEYREALLKKDDYYENCPGCQVDQLKELKKGFPFRDLISIWIVVLCTGKILISNHFGLEKKPESWLAACQVSLIYGNCDVIFCSTSNINSLSIPLFHGEFLNMFYKPSIRDFGIAEREEDIGYYAGYVGSSFMIGRALTSVLWGIVADRYGRKPVILLGTIAVVIFNTLFGLSVNFWMAIITRFLLGSLNGLLGPIKAYAVEIFRAEYQALGLSTVSTAWGIGLIIGPALGGFLAQPAEKYPNLFSKDSLFGRFPYFLPCFCISLFALVVTIVSCWLPETLHVHNEKKTSSNDSYDALEAATSASKGDETRTDDKGRKPSSNESLLKNWPLMSSIIVYCIFSLHDMAYTEIFSLWAESSRKLGGLGYTTEDVGEVLAISGMFQPSCLSTFSVSIRGEDSRTDTGSSNLSGKHQTPFSIYVISILLLSSYPFIAMLSGLGLSILINCASIMKNVFSVSIITGLFILQNNAVDQNQRGAANGISMTGMSIFKAAGPAGGGAILSWAQRRQNAAFLPGVQMVFFILNAVELIGVLMTFKPFLAQRQDRPRNGTA